MKPLFYLLDLLFPPCCAFCRRKLAGESVLPLCSECEAALLSPAGCCPHCGYPLPEDSRDCPTCFDRAFAFDGACAASLYRGQLKKAVYRYKYGGEKGLAQPFGRIIALQVKKYPWPSFDAVVPIPLHHKKLLQRGYDQSLLLARAVAGQLKIPLVCGLRRRRETVSQTSLTAAQRWQNVREAFTCAAGSLPQKILLVDDLLTTGATAHFAALAARRGGAVEVYLAVIARSEGYDRST
ncbi:MAG TPA: ComF family protein [Firmicutes bacterium]|nr:ComF family protein [Bacillota bacterium]